MATAHLIAGLPCAGKTSYAKTIASRIGAVHLMLDSWLIGAFGHYSIEDVGQNEHVVRVRRLRSLLWDVASEFLQRGINVILDDGFFLRSDRIAYIPKLRSIRADGVMHFLDTEKDVILSRLSHRNNHLPAHNFRINSVRLEQFYEMFEVPAQDEGFELIVIRKFDLNAPQLQVVPSQPNESGIP